MLPYSKGSMHLPIAIALLLGDRLVSRQAVSPCDTDTSLRAGTFRTLRLSSDGQPSITTRFSTDKTDRQRI